MLPLRASSGALASPKRGKVRGPVAVGGASVFVRLSPTACNGRRIRSFLEHARASLDEETADYDLWRIPAARRTLQQLTAICRAAGIRPNEGPFHGAGRDLDATGAGQIPPHARPSALRRATFREAYGTEKTTTRAEVSAKRHALWDRLCRILDVSATELATAASFPADWPLTAGLLNQLSAAWSDTGRLWNVIRARLAVAMADVIASPLARAPYERAQRRMNILTAWLTTELRRLSV